MHEGLKAAKNTRVRKPAQQFYHELTELVGEIHAGGGDVVLDGGCSYLRCATPAEAGLKDASKIGESRLGCWLVALLPQCLFCCCWWGSSEPAQWFVLLSLPAVCVCVCVFYTYSRLQRHALVLRTAPR
jgi:hypothetical protein